MPPDKPLAYQSSNVVLEYISFGKRKRLHAMCPAIRKMEENLPYHLELVKLISMARNGIIMSIDSFSFYFWEHEGNKMLMTNECTENSVEWLTCLGPEQAAEKFLLYHLSRKGTHIKNVELTAGPEFISKCIPITIKNLIVNRTAAWFPTNEPVDLVKVDTTVRADTLKMAKHVTVKISDRINTKIVSEWNCEFIRIESTISSEEVAYYCNQVSKRANRPIGSMLMANHTSSVELVFDLLPSKEYARKTMLNDKKCVTISIDESTELNVYGSSVDCYCVVVEVCARGTAIDQVY
ncbi:hypothetical protein GCK72_020744 [Caenorhabditis remanei]|uniref:DUF38 domain-containing protein n=1 Tax=Caenorhabditis remanei TaxID=31234 RepID=A0A6A5GHE4_CAERE|nr:hypothetical protein GCK72_020744 [Caenorhabditis remanei]KAF1754184.1 hypothetical protein GCK72_020744 [Caenorhabditis remanei]